MGLDDIAIHAAKKLEQESLILPNTIVWMDFNHHDPREFIPFKTLKNKITNSGKQNHVVYQGSNVPVSILDTPLSTTVAKQLITVTPFTYTELEQAMSGMDSHFKHILSRPTNGESLEQHTKETNKLLINELRNYHEEGHQLMKRFYLHSRGFVHKVLDEGIIYSPFATSMDLEKNNLGSTRKLYGKKVEFTTATHELLKASLQATPYVQVLPYQLKLKDRVRVSAKLMAMSGVIDVKSKKFATANSNEQRSYLQHWQRAIKTETMKGSYAPFYRCEEGKWTYIPTPVTDIPDIGVKILPLVYKTDQMTNPLGMYISSTKNEVVFAPLQAGKIKNILLHT